MDTLHCNENHIYVFPEKESRGLNQFPHSCVYERFIYSQNRSYCNQYFPVLREKTLGSTAGAKRRAGNCRQAGVGGSSLLILLRVNEIPNETFILDSHRPFICSVAVFSWWGSGAAPVTTKWPDGWCLSSLLQRVVGLCVRGLVFLKKSQGADSPLSFL